MKEGIERAISFSVFMEDGTIILCFETRLSVVDFPCGGTGVRDGALFGRESLISSFFSSAVQDNWEHSSRSSAICSKFL